MRVILRRDVPKLGGRGEVVEVAGGYARNYLLPKGIAYEATAENERRIAKERRQADQVAEAQAAEAKAVADRLAGISATVQVKADGETIYGSVGPEEIVAAIASEHGLQVDSESVRLEEPIKKVGTHDVLFRLAEGAEATVKVWVLPEDGELPPAEGTDAEAAPGSAPGSASEAGDEKPAEEQG
ncbi:MAG: 50S ribosomal protein L9 [Planctomycetota bacterium]|jgi:large subunit ribosomal protein L9